MTKIRVSTIAAVVLMFSPLAAAGAHAQEMTSEQIQQQLDKLGHRGKTRSLQLNNSVDTNQPLYPAPPQPPAPEAIELPFYQITFALDSADIRPSSFETLNQIINVLIKPQNQHLSFELIGHTDAQGSAAYNLALSKRRAASVQRYLVQQGIDVTLLHAEGRGESELADPANPNGEKNRRVVLRATIKED